MSNEANEGSRFFVYYVNELKIIDLTNGVSQKSEEE